MLLSSLPRAEPSRLAWLKRNPIAVAAGRINQNVPRYTVPGWYTLLIVPDGISGADRVSPRYYGRSHFATLAVSYGQVREVTLRIVRIGFHGLHDCPKGWMDHLIVGCAVSRSNVPVGVPADALRGGPPKRVLYMSAPMGSRQQMPWEFSVLAIGARCAGVAGMAAQMGAIYEPIGAAEAAPMPDPLSGRLGPRNDLCRCGYFAPRHDPYMRSPVKTRRR